MTTLINRFKCAAGFHETHSKAEDLNYDFNDIDLGGLTVVETEQAFFELTAIRCRHCAYRFGR